MVAGKVATAQEALASVKKLRATIREFAASTEDDLRSAEAAGRQHAGLPVGADDLDPLAATILQIQEIKAHERSREVR